MVLEGKLIKLREQQEEDLPFLVSLRNNLETQAWSKSLPPDFTLEMYQQDFLKREFSYDRTDGKFIIEEITSGHRVGYIGYGELIHRFSAVIGVMTDKKYWGKGYALEANSILLNFLFHELGLRVLRLYTHSGNKKAVNLAQRLGFVISVRQRESIFMRGQIYDNLIMDILREEYYALHSDLIDNLPEP